MGSHRHARLWTSSEDHLLLDLLQQYGSRWRKLAAHFPGRGVASIRNRHQRLQQSQRGFVGKNLCSKCGKIRRGHVCAAVLTEDEETDDEDDVHESDQDESRVQAEEVLDAEEMHKDDVEEVLEDDAEQEMQADDVQQDHRPDDTRETPAQPCAGEGRMPSWIYSCEMFIVALELGLIMHPSVREADPLLYCDQNVCV